MGEAEVEADFAGAFTDAAATFTELDEVLWDPISRATVLRAAPRFDERVLDACAGAGASALPTSELVGPGGLVDAVDRAEPMLATLRERAGVRTPWLRVHEADATTWPYTGYDLVQCVLGVFFFADVAAGVEHLVQCARPGGRVALTVWADGAFEPLPGLLASALPEDDARVPTLDEDDGPAMAGAGTAGGLAHWLAERGLVDVRAEAVPRHLDLTPEVAWALVVGTGMRAMLGDLDDEAIGVVRERYLAAIEQQGVASVDITTLIGIGRRPGPEPEPEVTAEPEPETEDDPESEGERPA
ncbi:class I SAM-dependent methyltransferase [Agromyces luteolus]|uniref:Methyltransferase domain-containing protein n=1 Tax=Agromyces luteolus TaxID=88373 RepID=A0A7C9LGT7_9MICO|nr:class I SAM-dependent methyltransferase [Agromyces luteolus]MUN09030.1 methyltransferase domain-containing protein [Agromyces luteolus]